MAVVEPDLKPLMGKGLLYDYIDIAVMVDVEGSDSDVRFRRPECDIRVLATCEVQFDLKTT